MDTDQLLQAYAVQVAGEMGTNETTSTSQLMEYGKRHFTPEQFLGVYPAGHKVPRTMWSCMVTRDRMKVPRDP